MEAITLAIDDNRASWVLDPQGVTYFFDAYTVLRGAVSVTVLFSEDTERTIFTDEYRDNAPSKWMMRLPDAFPTTFDADGDGQGDVVSWFQYYDDYGEDMTNVLNITLNNGLERFETEFKEQYDYHVSLIHQNGHTELLVDHSEYDYQYVDTYTISEEKVEHVTGDEISLTYITRKSEERTDGLHEYVSPEYILSDPSRIRIFKFKDDASETQINGIMSVDECGGISYAME